jgi:hypothetical protein
VSGERDSLTDWIDDELAARGIYTTPERRTLAAHEERLDRLQYQADWTRLDVEDLARAWRRERWIAWLLVALLVGFLLLAAVRIRGTREGVAFRPTPQFGGRYPLGFLREPAVPVTARSRHDLRPFPAPAPLGPLCIRITHPRTRRRSRRKRG